jgi:hypothetical protein
MFVVGYLITAAISAGASYLAHMLLKPKRVKPPYDGTLPTLAQSGSPIPQLIGRRKLSPLFTAAWNRQSYVGASGRKYFEAGWHQLCNGPVHALHRIRIADKVYWEGPITRDDTPSGTTITIEEEGEEGGSWFTIFWGECDQGGAPPNDDLATYLGNVIGGGTPVTSIWPNLCHIVWGRKFLGFSPTWQQMDYELESRVESTTTTLADSPAWLDATTTVNDEGVNPGHALWMMLSGKHPHGIAVPVAFLSDAGFEQLGVTCATEHLPCNMLTAGDDASDVLSQFMGDVGFYIPHEAGRLRPRVIRSQPLGSIPVVPLDLTVDYEPEQEYARTDLFPDRVVMSFADRNQAFTTREVTWDSDANARTNGRPQERRFDLPNVTDRRTAWKIVRRRLMEASTQSQSFKATTTRGTRRLTAGQSVLLGEAGEFGQAVVQSVKPSTTTSKVELELVRDEYSYGISTYVPSNADELPILDGTS